MITEPTPAYDVLRAALLAFQLGIEDAERGQAMPELAPWHTAYEARAAAFRLCLAKVEAAIAALITPIDRHGALVARRAGIERQIVRLDAQIAHTPDEALIEERRELAAKAARLTGLIAGETEL